MEEQNLPAALCYSQRMQITLNIPDDLARQVAPEGKDPARVALEALALEGYRTELLSESALRQMLGFQTRMEVHAFLKQHGVYLRYDVSDLQQDRATAQQVRRKLGGSESLGERRLDDRRRRRLGSARPLPGSKFVLPSTLETLPWRS